MDSKRVYIGLDVGERRIGVAVADSIGRIAQPMGAIVADGNEFEALQRTAGDTEATDFVIGLPRNQSGATTPQTTFVQEFAEELAQRIDLPQHWQDESVTSVMAEERLKSRKKPYTKSDIDAEAACIILQDYLEHA